MSKKNSALTIRQAFNTFTKHVTKKNLKTFSLAFAFGSVSAVATYYGIDKFFPAHEGNIEPWQDMRKTATFTAMALLSSVGLGLFHDVREKGLFKRNSPNP